MERKYCYFVKRIKAFLQPYKRTLNYENKGSVASVKTIADFRQNNKLKKCNCLKINLTIIIQRDKLMSILTDATEPVF